MYRLSSVLREKVSFMFLYFMEKITSDSACKSSNYKNGFFKANNVSLNGYDLKEIGKNIKK